MPCFHIVAVTAALDRALAIRTPAAVSLPSLDGLTRITLPAVIEAMFAQDTAPVELVHWAPLPPEMSRDDSHSYCVVIISASVVSEGVELVPIDALLSDGTLSTVQREALTTALSRLRSPIHPFDSATQVADALLWAERVISEQTGSPSLSKRRRRCERYNYVVQFETVDGTMYFKGGPDRTGDEATLADLLWKVRPRQIPETVAIDRARHCWLYRALPGEPLRGPRLTTATAASAARALASIQKEAMKILAVQDHLADRRLNAMQLLQEVDGVVADVFTLLKVRGEDVLLVEAWRRSIDTIRRKCVEVDGLHLPQTLVISDFWNENVLVTPDGFGFIDVGYSYWSYPFLPLWRFTRDVDRQLQSGGGAYTAIARAFVEEWADVVSASRMNLALDSVGLLGRLFAVKMASLDLDLHERDLGIQLPAEYRAASLASRVRRVLSFVKASSGATA